MHQSRTFYMVEGQSKEYVAKGTRLFDVFRVYEAAKAEGRSVRLGCRTYLGGRHYQEVGVHPVDLVRVAQILSEGDRVAVWVKRGSFSPAVRMEGSVVSQDVSRGDVKVKIDGAIGMPRNFPVEGVEYLPVLGPEVPEVIEEEEIEVSSPEVEESISDAFDRGIREMVEVLLPIVRKDYRVQREERGRGRDQSVKECYFHSEAMTSEVSRRVIEILRSNISTGEDGF